MKRYILSFVISFCIHSFVIIIMYWAIGDAFLRYRPIVLRIDLIPEIPPDDAQQQPANSTIPESPKQILQPSVVESTEPLSSRRPPPAQHEGSVLMIPDTSSVYRQKPWWTFVSKKRKEQEFISFDLESLPPDSHFLPFLLEKIDPLPPQRDDVAEMIKKRNDGIGVMPSVSGLISDAIQQEASKDIPPQFDFIPNKIQVYAIHALKEHGKATQIDIYALLDPALPVTAETLNKNLETLMDKGFLSRKKISPQHSFNVFGIPIEMSAKNRKNPVYVYELKISEKTLVDFLQAQLTLAGDRLRTHPADSVRIRSRMESLQQKIQILIR